MLSSRNASSAGRGLKSRPKFFSTAAKTKPLVILGVLQSEAFEEASSINAEAAAVCCTLSWDQACNQLLLIYFLHGADYLKSWNFHVHVLPHLHLGRSTTFTEAPSTRRPSASAQLDAEARRHACPMQQASEVCAGRLRADEP